jgi:3-hydroxybutyryl-CoA dehydrogenase
VGVETIAVIGAGAMGRGIAYAAAFGAYQTVLEDISQEMLDAAVAWISQAFDESVAGGAVEAAVRDRALALISTATRAEEAIREADLIIEAVADEMEMKLELFTIFDKFAKPGAIFASSTRSLSIAEISDVTVHRERCVGLRFFDPVPRTKTMEIVRTAFTSDETVAACREMARRMRKGAVVLRESAGMGTGRGEAAP